MKLSQYLRKNSVGYAHWCPACKETHSFFVDQPTRGGARWSFDGNVERPTFNPSMNIRTGPRPTVPVGRPDAGQIDVCHYFLHAGKLQFCPDSTHALAGKTVDLPPLPPEPGER